VNDISDVQREDAKSTPQKKSQRRYLNMNQEEFNDGVGDEQSPI
jgi:hypothetical protein